MKTYQKSELSSDERGYFRYLGQKRFRLGKDESKAKLAAVKLEAIFKRAGTWNEATLTIAYAVAKGRMEVALPSVPDMAEPQDYVYWVSRFASEYGDIIRVIPAHGATFNAGATQIVQERAEAFRLTDMGYPLPAGVAGDLPHERLHAAIDAYCLYLQKRTDVSGWIKTQVNQAQRLKSHKDIPLSAMTLAVMDDMLTYWANRPPVKDKNKPGKPMSALTARNQMKQLRDFWRWLNRSDDYRWKRPDTWDELKPRIAKLPSDRKINTLQVKTFTVEELCVYYRNASPLVRCFILLGMNCGFSTAEIASLTTDEISLNSPHPHADLVDITTSNADSWIMRIRRKSGVYGEWRLWPQTVQAIRWAEARRRRVNTRCKQLLITETGKPYDTLTSGGNKPYRIPSLWNNAYAAASKDKPGIRFLSIKHLRKTAGDLIRKLSDGETAGVFLCHGHPVKSDVLADVYTNRPFGRVFEALAKVEKLLAPMFQGVEWQNHINLHT